MESFKQKVNGQQTRTLRCLADGASDHFVEGVRNDVYLHPSICVEGDDQ